MLNLKLFNNFSFCKFFGVIFISIQILYPLYYYIFVFNTVEIMDSRFAWRMFASQEIGKCDYQSFAYLTNSRGFSIDNETTIAMHLNGFIKDKKTRWLLERYCSERLFSDTFYFICKNDKNFYKNLLLNQKEIKKEKDNIWVYQIYYRYLNLYGIEIFNNTLTFICNF